jgi:WD40 repeat protein
MLTSSYDNALYIHVYNTTTLQYTSERLSADVEMKVNCMCDLYDGSYIAVGVNNNIGCFDYDMDNLLFSFKAHDSNVNDIVYILDKDIVISCANDKVVKVWKYNDRECICVFNEINHIINRLSVIVINNEINIIGISKEGSVVCLNMNTKEHVSNFEFADCEWIDIVNVGDIPSIITINKKGSFTLFDLKSGSYKEHNNNNNNEFIGGFYDNTGNNILLFSSKMEYQIWSTN